MTIRRTSLAERFWPKVDRSSGPDSCWPWTGFIDSTTGYGRIGRAGRQSSHGKSPYFTHRVAYALANNLEPDELEGYICHTCDNRYCCNPTHLWLGTARENIQDAMRKGRMHIQRAKRDDRGRITATLC